MHLYAAGDNPFAAMAGKPNASYFQQLYDVECGLDKTHPDEWLHTIAQLHEAGRQDPRLDWEAQLLEIRYRQEVDSLPPLTAVDEQAALAARAGKSGHTHMQLHILFALFNNYRYTLNDFDHALNVGEQLVAIASGMDVATSPNILRYYAEIGEVCWLLGYYNEMMTLMKPVMLNPLAAHDAHALALAYNNMGIYYLYQKRYDDAEHMFRIIRHRDYIVGKGKQPDDEWAAIADGNIGHVLYKRGNYRQSIPYLQAGLKGASRSTRATYAACKYAILLGNIYVSLNRPDSVAYYIRLAEQYNHARPFVRHEMDIWMITSEYYFITKRQPEAQAALDSALDASNRFHETFNPNREARFRRNTHLEQAATGDTRLTVVLTVLILSLAGYPLYHLHRKRRNARRPERPAAEEAERLLFYRVTQYMEEEKPYLHTDFSITKMSHDLGVNRSYLSTTINTYAKCNFRAFINNYRVRAAIEKLEKNEEKNLSVEAIGEEVGFPDRYRFYRVFKEITNTSPMQYLKQRSNVASGT
jgi:AraC-like DNA-binding protein